MQPLVQSPHWKGQVECIALWDIALRGLFAVHMLVNIGNPDISCIHSKLHAYCKYIARSMEICCSEKTHPRTYLSLRDAIIHAGVSYGVKKIVITGKLMYTTIRQ